MNYIVILGLLLIAFYVHIINKISLGDFIITLGLILIAMIIEGWNKYDSKTKFRE